MVRFVVLVSAMIVAHFFWAGEFKDGTREVKNELHYVNQSLVKERERVRVLKAEWAHRTEPETLMRLAQDHLGLGAVRIEQIATIEDVPYLGMNLYEDELEATPVNYADAPRRKPSIMVATSVEQQAADQHAALSPIEYVVAGPGSRRRK